MFGWISQGLGWILYQLNNLVGNYGFAIILFTVLVKACMFPLTMKQLRSTAKMQEIQPKLNALQKKYANDRDRFAQEQMKLYKEAGVSPFSGCLPMLIQMPILFCLYYAIMYPLENQLWISKDLLEQLPNLGDFKPWMSGYDQLNWVVEQVKNGVNEFALNGQTWPLNFDFNFIGIDLGRVATIKGLSDGTLATLWPNYLLSVLAGALTFLSMKLSNANSKKNNEQKKVGEEENPAAGMSNTMQYMMPLMTLWFTTIVPTAMTMYWVVSNLIQIIQQYVTNALMAKEKKVIADRLAAEKAESERRRQLFAEEKVAASMHNMSKKKQKRLKEEKKEKDHQERLEKRNHEKASEEEQND